jgi:hypothetical protein
MTTKKIILIIITTIILASLVLAGSLYFVFRGVRNSFENEHYGPYTNWDSRELVWTYSPDQFCGELGSTEVFEVYCEYNSLTDDVVRTDYTFGDFNITTYTHPTSIFDERPYFIFSFFDNDVSEESTAPHPRRLNEVDGYYFQDYSYPNNGFVLMKKENGQRGRIFINSDFSVSEECRGVYDEMTNRIEQANSLVNEDFSTPESFIDSDLDGVQRHPTGNFVTGSDPLRNGTIHRFGDNKLFLEYDEDLRQFSVVFQNVLISVPSLEDIGDIDAQEMRIYRFRFKSQDRDYQTWEIRECPTFEGEVLGGGRYEFYRAYDSREINVLAEN